MHTIFKDFTFSAAHAIRGHTRGCENLHGHNYRVRVHVAATELDGLGMVLDFADLKAMVQEILGPYCRGPSSRWSGRAWRGAATPGGCRWRGSRCGRTTPPAPSTSPDNCHR